MKSPAYNEALAYATEVLKAVKESGCEVDYALKQFVDASVHIGADLATADNAMDQKQMQEAYDEANKNVEMSLYWLDILSEIKDYDKIPFESLRKKCEDLRIMINQGVNVISTLLGRRMF